MIEITWRYDPAASFVEATPATAAEARDLLVAGNAAFAQLGGDGPSSVVVPVTPEDLGFGSAPGSAPRQAPFAALLGCADARVPLELLLSQGANDAFVVRVAGNVLAAECLGSLDYAVAHLADLRALAVVGHTGCGAVGAAVDAYLDPTSYLAITQSPPLRAVVDALMASVRGADVALAAAHGRDVVDRAGYRAALLDTAVVLNAAVVADAVRNQFKESVGDKLGVFFGVYDLVSRRVGLPGGAEGDEPWVGQLLEPPSGEGVGAFALAIARSGRIARGLDPAPGSGA